MSGITQSNTRTCRIRYLWFAGMIVILLALAFLCLSQGSYPLSLSQLVRIVAGKEESRLAVRVFYRLRVPRMLMALLTGLALGVGGGVFSGLFQNPLASPDVVGISQGASLGAAIALLYGSGGTGALVGGAFLGSLGALLFVLLLVKLAPKERGTVYILAGMIVSSLTKAAIMLLKTMADSEQQIAAVEFWTMGSFGAVTGASVLPVFICLIIGFCGIFILRRDLFLLTFGEGQAAQFGVAVRKKKMLLLLLAALPVAAVTAQVGVIAFIGLLAPQITLLLYRSRTKGYLVLCSLTGACLVMASDYLARSFSKYGALPVSILTSFLAAPLLGFLLVRRQRRLQ